MREYMLPAHKRLIEAVECGPSIREYVKKSNNMKASSAYDACLRRLAEYRSYHLRIVVRFLAMPSSKTTNSKPIQGTGGTHAVKYLKSTRTATKESILNTDD
ncbi:indoleamine 2,3-dioxygenase 2-like [Saccoglossus kowalevskii]